MPWAPKKPCAARSCAELVERDRRWCEKHQADADEREKARKAAFDQTRPSASARGYTSDQWREIRRQVLKRDPWCTTCGRARSTRADHTIPKRQGGTDDLSNLKGKCESCHNRKTALDSGFVKGKAGKLRRLEGS